MEDELENVVEDIKKEKIIGANITVPYKQKIIPYLDELSEISKKTNSVNTIYKKMNKVFGENTDVFGFTESIKHEIN